jgi:hypothetical protein
MVLDDFVSRKKNEDKKIRQHREGGLAFFRGYR